MDVKLLRSALAIIAGLATASSGLAQTSANNGYVSGTQEVLASVPLEDGLVAQRLMFRAVVIADDESSPYHLVSQDCFASYIFSGDLPVGGKGACDGISPDGDIFWLSLEMSPEGVVHWRGTGGTGKFESLEASGTTVVVAQLENGKFVGRYEGTYTNR